MARRAERDGLRGVVDVGCDVGVGGEQLVEVDQVAGLGWLSGARVAHGPILADRLGAHTRASDHEHERPEQQGARAEREHAADGT